MEDMFDDAFTAIARDGAGTVEAMVRLQKALESLSSLDDPSVRAASIAHAGLALARAEGKLDLPEDLALVREAAASPGQLDPSLPRQGPRRSQQRGSLEMRLP